MAGFGGQFTVRPKSREVTVQANGAAGFNFTKANAGMLRYTPITEIKIKKKRKNKNKPSNVCNADQKKKTARDATALFKFHKIV